MAGLAIHRRASHGEDLAAARRVLDRLVLSLACSVLALILNSRAYVADQIPAHIFGRRRVLLA